MTLEMWLFIVGALLSISGFLCVFILTGIKREIGEMKESVKELSGDLHENKTDMEQRVTRLETRCEHNHPAHPIPSHS